MKNYFWRKLSKTSYPKSFMIFSFFSWFPISFGFHSFPLRYTTKNYQQFTFCLWFWVLFYHLKQFKMTTIHLSHIPYKRHFFTTLKTPMADKTFSQEQYEMRFFRFNVSIQIHSTSTISENNLLPLTLSLDFFPSTPSFPY